MTRRKHLKARVRARMEKTGERYATARRHVLTQLDSAPPQGTAIASPPSARSDAAVGPVAPVLWHAPGSVPAAASLRTLMGCAGAVRGAAPPSEAMLFGVGGGVGVGVHAFRYEQEDVSTFFLGARHAWEDDLVWLRATCARLDLNPVVRETGGAKRAVADLEDLLGAHGPVIAFVDMATFPHRAPMGVWEGGGYHVLVVHALEGGEVWVSDLADAPYRIDADLLARARGRIRKFKNRLVAFDPAGVPVTADRLRAAAREGIRAGAEGLLEGGRKSARLEALAEWADHLRARSGPRAWRTMFRPGPNLLRGLLWIHVSVEYWGSGGGLGRPLQAEFLKEAAGLLGEEELIGSAAAYADLGSAWGDLADAALPSTVPGFARLKEAYARKAECYMSHGLEAADEAEALEAEIAALTTEAGSSFPLDEAACGALLDGLADRVEAIHAAEVEAARDLAAR